MLTRRRTGLDGMFTEVKGFLHSAFDTTQTSFKFKELGARLLVIDDDCMTGRRVQVSFVSAQQW